MAENSNKFLDDIKEVVKQVMADSTLRNMPVKVSLLDRDNCTHEIKEVYSFKVDLFKKQLEIELQ